MSIANIQRLVIQKIARHVKLYKYQREAKMTQLRLLISVVVILVTSVISAQAKDTIDSKSEFIEKVAGKRIADPKLNTWMVAQPNGQIKGKFKGINIKGKWNWNGKYWCRSARIGLISLSLECQQITLAGSTLILQRKKGTGSSHTYQLN